MAADDGDPGTPEVVIGHAARAVDAPPVGEEDESAASTTVVTSEPEGSDRRTHLTVPPGGHMHVEGSYRGTESFGPTTGRCPDLDHELGATLTLTDGTVWELDSSYCGTLDGDDWTGLGQFSLTTPSGDTLIGPLTSTATLPTDGEPFALHDQRRDRRLCRGGGLVHPRQPLASTRRGSAGAVRHVHLRHRRHTLDLTLRSRDRGAQPEVTLRAKSTARSSIRSLS